MSIVNLKIIFVKKQKQTDANAYLKAGAQNSFITEMAVFTLEADYSGETGYLFDNSRQIGNTSEFENGMVSILNQNNPPGFLRQF